MKIIPIIIAVFLALIMIVSVVNAENLVDFGTENGNPYAVYEYSWWDNLFKEQSVYDVAFGTSDSFIKDNAVTYNTYFFTKFNDVSDYKIVFSFYDKTTDKFLSSSFFTYKGGNTLVKDKKYSLTQTVSSHTIKSLLPDSVCNHYISVMGTLFVKIPADKISQVDSSYNKVKEGNYYWVQEYYNLAGTHANSKYTLLSCPAVKPTCNPLPGKYDTKCDKSSIVQNVIWGDCSQHWELVKTCGNGCDVIWGDCSQHWESVKLHWEPVKTYGNGCENAQCIAGCDKVGQTIKTMCDGTTFREIVYGQKCEYMFKDTANSEKCGYEVPIPPVIPPVEPPLIKRWLIENNVCIEKESAEGFVTEADCKVVLEDSSSSSSSSGGSSSSSSSSSGSGDGDDISREVIFYIIGGFVLAGIAVIIYNRKYR